MHQGELRTDHHGRGSIFGCLLLMWTSHSKGPERQEWQRPKKGRSGSGEEIQGKRGDARQKVVGITQCQEPVPQEPAQGSERRIQRCRHCGVPRHQNKQPELIVKSGCQSSAQKTAQGRFWRQERKHHEIRGVLLVFVFVQVFVKVVFLLVFCVFKSRHLVGWRLFREMFDERMKLN